MDLSSISGSGAAEDFPFPKVLILYDDAAAGQRAVRLLANVFSAQDRDLEFQAQLWRFDFLEDPEWSGEAVADAINADIVVISTSATASMNSTIARWTKFCQERKRGTPGAVVAMLGGGRSHDESNRPQLQSLEAAARDSGLAFFAPESQHHSPGKTNSCELFSQPRNASDSHNFRGTQ